MNIARLYSCRPSSLVGLEEPYEAFCFDEACAFIQMKIDNDEEPVFRRKYKSFTELYAQYS